LFSMHDTPYTFSTFEYSKYSYYFRWEWEWEGMGIVMLENGNENEVLYYKWIFTKSLINSQYLMLKIKMG